jgi:hypothetical protein
MAFMKTLEAQPSRSRWPLAVGVLVGLLGFGHFLVVLGCRIDTVEGSAFMISAAPERAVPLGISAFLLALDLGRCWKNTRRLGFALLAFGVVWVIAWQMLLYQAHYPDRLLRSIDTSALWPNNAHAAYPATTSLYHGGCQWRGVADARPR